MSFLLVSTTTATREEAERIAEALVHERAAACVQISGPIQSRYRWQGRIEDIEEWHLVAKSRACLYDRAEAVIARLHSYAVPEIVAVNLAAGSSAYLAWVETETRPEP